MILIFYAYTKLEENKMTKLKNKEFKVKYKEDEGYGVYITYIDGEVDGYCYEKMVYFTRLEHEIQFTDLLKEAGYTYVQEETSINA